LLVRIVPTIFRAARIEAAIDHVFDLMYLAKEMKVVNFAQFRTIEHWYFSST